MLFKLTILSGAAASLALFVLFAAVALAPILGLGQVSLDPWYQQPLILVAGGLLALSVLSGLASMVRR